MWAQDARAEERHPVRIPIRFFSADGSASQGTSYAEACNVSRSGLFMTSATRLQVGAVIMLVLRVPTEISGSVFSELRCMGTVVHEQITKDGKLGYGVKITAVAPRDLLRSTEQHTRGWNSCAV
jgi:hypothetical protein